MSETLPQKRVGLWLRVSTQMQAEESDSLEHHKVRGEGYAISKDWNIVETYCLEGVSGKAVLDHPEGKRMIADIKRGHISGLVFSKLARLARSTKELLEIAEIFQTHDASLVSLSEAIDTSTPAGHLFFTIISAMAEWERKEISARVKASIPIRAKLGKSLGGVAPYGYQWNDDNTALMLDDIESPIRKLMFELYLEHKRFKSVARVLKEKGIKGRNGAHFSATTIKRCLTDPIAKGERITNYSTAGGGRSFNIKPESEWIRVKTPSIVSEELFDAVGAIIEKNTYKQNRARKPKHFLSGSVVCGQCPDEKMYIPTNSTSFTCRKCHHKIPKDDLEAIFEEQLKTFLLSDEHINEYLDSADSVILDKTNLLEVLSNRMADIAKAKKKLFDLHMPRCYFS